VFYNSAAYSLESVYFFLSKSGSPSKRSLHLKMSFICSNIDPSISILERTKCFPLKLLTIKRFNLLAIILP